MAPPVNYTAYVLVVMNVGMAMLAMGLVAYAYPMFALGVACIAGLLCTPPRIYIARLFMEYVMGERS